MEKEIITILKPEDLKKLIIEAIRETNLHSSNFSQSESTEAYLDQKEAAKFLRVSLPTIIRWKKEKKIPYYQEGRKVLFKKSELLQMLKRN